MKLTDIYLDILAESIQLADKLYFKTNKLSDEDRKIVMSVTNGDNYSKFISDVLILFKNPMYYGGESIKELKQVYNQITSYDKNVFPIIGLENINNVEDLAYKIDALKAREKAIKEIKKLPSIGIRNLRNDIRKPRSSGELHNYLESLEYFTGQLSYLENKSEAGKQKIYQKLFKNNMTLDQLTNFLEDKENLISGEEVTKEGIISVVNENPDDLSIIYENKNYMIIKVESPEGIRSIGCNSLWCFTYGSGFDNAYRQWYNYSTNDIVYVIVNFNVSWEDPEFMNVVIKPINFEKAKYYGQYKLQFGRDTDNEYDEDSDDDQIYNLFNEPQYDSINFLRHTIGLNAARRILTFD
jgi:hypothetical protein